MDAPLSIGLSALLTAQRALDFTGHNIANATTPNYTRQRVDLVSLPPGALGRLASGTGVAVVRVTAVRDALTDRALLAQDSAAAGASRRAQFLSQIEAVIGTDPEADLGAAIDGLFSSFQDLSRNPAGAVERHGVVAQANSLALAFQQLDARLRTVQEDLLPHALNVVDQINTLTAQIAALNGQIRDTVAADSPPHDLIDQRTTALRQLAELIPVHTLDGSLSRVNVRCGGMLLVSGESATPLTARLDGSILELRVGDSDVQVQPTGGELGALLELATTTLPHYFERLDTLAATLVREVNQLHATGVGRDGSFVSLTGTTAVSDPDVALAGAGLPFALQGGDLYVSIIDEATGEVTQAAIAFDPRTDSLADLAAALDAVDHLDAAVRGGVLDLRAEAGYRFDFTNKVVSRPGDLGGSAVALSGAAALDANDTYTFTVDTSGTVAGPGSTGLIGATAGLRVTVTDASGRVVARLDVGEGYEAGQALELPGGIAAAFGAGSVGDGDALSVDLVAEPDAQGLLAALGLNTLLRGTTAAGFALEAAVAANPNLIAAGRSDAAGDNRNALRLVELQDQALGALGDDTVGGYHAQLVGRVGIDALVAQRAEQSALTLRESVENQRDALSGVDQDEELIKLMQYQQLYTIAARYLRTIDELTSVLLSI